MLIKIKFQFPEIVIGILLAAALFAIGFVVASSQLPQNNQQQSNPAERAAQISPPSSAEERLADYTLALAWLTGALAVSTVGLWIVTYFAFRHSRETAERQLRAFVFMKGFRATPSIQDGVLSEYIFSVTYENVGLTPALGLRAWIKFESFPMIEDPEPNFSVSGSAVPITLGPRSINQIGFATVPIDTLRKKWSNETEIFLWARIEYCDIFDPTILHHHEQCAIIALIHEPSTIPPPGHPPYVISNFYGSQNTTG